MKISLKTLLVCIVLLSIGLRLYLLHRAAELGVKVPVPKPIELEEYYDAPSFLTEFRSRWQVREHDGLDQAEKAKDKEAIRAKLLLSLAEFSSNVHLEILHENKDEMIALAHSQIEDPDFKTARNAAWVLDHFGDETAYPKARQRLVDLYAQKPRPGYRPFYDFLDCFGREQLARDQEFIDFARSLTNEPNQLDWASTSFLSYQNIDEEPHYQYMLRKAKNGRDKAYAFIWLVENKFTQEVKDALVKYLDDGKVPSYSRIPQFLQIENGDPDWTPIRNRIETFAYKSLCDPDPPRLPMFQEWYWSKFTECATEASVEFLMNAFDNTKGHSWSHRSERILLSCAALDRLGYRKEAETLLKAMLEAVKNEALSASECTEREMFDLAEKFWGRDEKINLCIEHVEQNSSHGGGATLADMFAGTKNEEIASVLAGSATVDHIERIGSARLPNIWSSMSSRQGTYALYARWKTRGTDRQDFLDWINSELQPGKPLTIEGVLAHPMYPEKNDLWEIGAPTTDTDHQFALVALAHSGKGNLVRDYWENRRDCLTSMLLKFSDVARPEFEVTSSDENWGNGFLNLSFVVNKRLYKFSITESRWVVLDETTGEGYFESDYPKEAMLEILNAIAIRQQLRGRFFMFDGEGLGPDVNLVAFLTPKQMEDLDEKFAILPNKDFEFFLDH